ncbi:MAG TPA: hydroxymethylbilane synthase [Desulfatiglandales bacterium]
MILRIGTRGSKLALVQSEWVKKEVQTRHPEVRVELVKIKTEGDKVLDSPLSKIGGKGLFVKEIEDALLRNDVDLAVHSLKDVPGDLPTGLSIAVYPKREDPRDALVSKHFKTVKDLPQGASVGTSSLRRSAQLLHMRPDLHFVPLRGNVDTRLRKLDSGDLQAIVLATAGLNRLGLSDRITAPLSPEAVLPAIGQGVLGLELREDDQMTQHLIFFLNDLETELAARAERAFLKELEGGCQVPLAGYARVEKDRIVLDGMVAELDGSVILRQQLAGGKDKPEELGIALARQLIAAGADRILEKIYG